MKAISLTQPWAWAVLHARKRAENRKRSDGKMPSICRHRGSLFLHTAKSMTRRQYLEASEWMEERGLAARTSDIGLPVIPSYDDLPRGCIVGCCEAIGYIEPDGSYHGLTVSTDPIVPDEYKTKRWWMGGWALVLSDVIQTNSVPCKGMLGLWEVADDICAKVEIDLRTLIA